MISQELHVIYVSKIEYGRLGTFGCSCICPCYLRIFSHLTYGTRTQGHYHYLNMDVISKSSNARLMGSINVFATFEYIYDINIAPIYQH